MHVLKNHTLFIILLLTWCVTSSYAQEGRTVVDGKKELRDAAQIDSLRKIYLDNISLPSLNPSEMKGKYENRLSGMKPPVFKSQLPSMSVPEVGIDTGKANAMKDSWLNRDWNFETNGKESKLPDWKGSTDVQGLLNGTGSLNTQNIQNQVANDSPLDAIDQTNVAEEASQAATQLNQQKESQLENGENVLESIQEKQRALNPDDLFSGFKQELLNAKTIYSEKALEQLRDSLGGPKFDSLFNVASTFIKSEVQEDDFLQAFNKVAPENSPADYVDAKNHSLQSPDEGQLNSLAENATGDLSKMQLPQSLLSELPPLAGKEIDSKYVDMVDSLRDINMAKEGLEVEEKKITEQLKSAVVKKKEGFWDKTYFDGVVGFLEQGDLTLLQLSPSLGYHFNEFVSLGLGPSVLLEIKDNDWNSAFGFRSFLRTEFFKHRLYFQAEDNMAPTAAKVEEISKGTHNFLVGGGGLLKLSNKIAINPCILYSVTGDTKTQSPWVFRLGISSIKLK